eukprot:162968_1
MSHTNDTKFSRHKPKGRATIDDDAKIDDMVLTPISATPKQELEMQKEINSVQVDALVNKEKEYKLLESKYNQLKQEYDEYKHKYEECVEDPDTPQSRVRGRGRDTEETTRQQAKDRSDDESSQDSGRGRGRGKVRGRDRGRGSGRVRDRGRTGIDTPPFIENPTFRHAPTLREYLELPPKEKEPEDIDFDIAIIYLRDALKIRPPQRRIRDLLQRTFKPLTAYKLMKSWIWAKTIYILIWMNMFLAVWEPPMDDMNEWNASRVRIIIIYQLCFCVIYSFDIYMKFYSHDKREIGQWTYIISFCVFYEAVIAIVTLFLYHNKQCELIYRSSRVIRPCFLFYKSRDLKKLARSILRGIPSLFEVGALITLFLLLFSFVAYYLFHENPYHLFGQNNQNFETFGESVYALVVLQTTANFPDVMMPSYDQSEWAALFFFIYNILGIYFLMALVLAVIYNNYSDHILHDVERIKVVRERAIKEAFKVLTLHQNSNKKQLNERGKRIRKKKQKYKRVVYFSTFCKIMKRMRGDLVSKFGDIGANEQFLWIYLTMANVAGRVDGEYEDNDAAKRQYDDGLNKSQFLEIASFIELEITKDIAKAKHISVLKKTEQFQTIRSLLVTGDEWNAQSRLSLLSKSIPIYWYQFRLKLIAFWQWKTRIICCKKRKKEKIMRHAQQMLMTIDSMFHPSNVRINSPPIKRHSTWSQDVIAQCSSFEISTEYFVNLLVMLSTIFVIMDVYHLSAKIDVFAIIIIYAFLAEVVLKMMAFGTRGYLNDNFNKLDCVLSILAFLFEIVLKNTIKIIIIFRIIGLLRLLHAFSRFRVILRTSKAVLSSFRSLFILEFCIAYVFAIVGMELFAGAVTKDKVEQMCMDDTATINANASGAEPLPIPFWCTIYTAYYYHINFNSFTHAIVVQMELIVVNNWHIITQMYVAQTSTYARIYFLFVYFTAVVVVMNVLTAFVLEAFISQYENNETEMRQTMDVDLNLENTEHKKAHDAQIESRMYEVKRLFKPEDEVTIYHYTRKLSKALFYEQLYPQLFNQQQQPNQLQAMINTQTQRSYINSMYSNYQTQRRHSNKEKAAKRSNRVIQFDTKQDKTHDYNLSVITSEEELRENKDEEGEEDDDDIINFSQAKLIGKEEEEEEEEDVNVAFEYIADDEEAAAAQSAPPTTIEAIEAIYMSRGMDVLMRRSFTWYDFEFMDNIGRGAFGVVDKSFHLKSCQIVALKRSRSLKQRMMDSFKREVLICAEFSSCPYIINMIECGIDESKNEICCALEYMNCASLMTRTRYSVNEIRRICFCVLSALCALHSKLYVHNDIKPDNILLNTSGEVKLSDFGCCERMRDEHTPLRRANGSLHYQSYEKKFASPVEYTTQSDIYSFGITCCEILNATHAAGVKQDTSDPSPYKIPNNVMTQYDPQCIDFLNKCLMKDYRTRWTAQQLLSHPFLMCGDMPASAPQHHYEEDDLEFITDTLINYYLNYNKNRNNNFKHLFRDLSKSKTPIDGEYTDNQRMQNIAKCTGYSIEAVQEFIFRRVNAVKNKYLKR